MLNQLSNEEEVVLISSILLSALGSKDRLIWKKFPNGQYSVSSSYEFAKHLKQQHLNLAGSSTALVEDKKNVEVCLGA